MLGLRPCRVRSGWQPVRERRAEVRCAATRTLRRLRVEFSVPYRVQFGQRLNLVGSGVLGEWDLQRAVPMTWSEGDIWRADLDTDLTPGDILHYKYIVSNSDGGVDEWKPGDDVVLEVPDDVRDRDGAELRILDTWDGAVHEVAVEDDRAADGGDSSPDDFMMSALQRSYADLEEKLDAAQSLLEATKDPGATEMVLADRELAIAANKASALTKVVEAATQAADLKKHPPHRS